MVAVVIFVAVLVLLLKQPINSILPVAALMLIFVLIGLAQGFWTVAASSTATEFGAESFGQAYGLAVMFCSFSMILPWGFARMNEALGGYTPGLLISAAIALLGTLAAAFLKQPRAQLATHAS